MCSTPRSTGVPITYFLNTVNLMIDCILVQINTLFLYYYVIDQQMVISANNTTQDKNDKNNYLYNEMMSQKCSVHRSDVTNTQTKE